MATKPRHTWVFARRFRRGGFSWKSQPAVARVKEAVSEIKKAARQDPVLGAEGAVLFLEKVAPALEHVDSSSGAIGSAVNAAIEALVPIIGTAQVDDAQREKWLHRLCQAVEDDDMPYIERLPDYWGTLCVTPERASKWADGFLALTRRVLGTADYEFGWYKGTSACFSSLFTAGRYDEIFALLEPTRANFWWYRKWGVKALAVTNRPAEAIRFAEASRGLNQPDGEISAVCERILLEHGLSDEAYSRYGIASTQRSTYLATFRALAAKYPKKPAAEILHDLVASTPGNEGKWFAAAKGAGMYDEAIALATAAPCDPKTLTRAARDFTTKNPAFAVEADMAALKWLVAGYGYEITNLDVIEAYRCTMAATQNLGVATETQARIRDLVASETMRDMFVTKALGGLLGITPPAPRPGPSSTRHDRAVH